MKYSGKAYMLGLFLTLLFCGIIGGSYGMIVLAVTSSIPLVICSIVLLGFVGGSLGFFLSAKLAEFFDAKFFNK